MLRLALLTAAVVLANASAAPGSGGLAVRVGVRRTAESLAELDRLFWAVATPGAPEYQQYLTPQQLQELTTSSATDTTLVSAWLGEAGCDAPALAETGDAVTSARCPEPAPVVPAALAEIVEFLHVSPLSLPTRIIPRTFLESNGRRRLQHPPPDNLGTPAYAHKPPAPFSIPLWSFFFVPWSLYLGGTKTWLLLPPSPPLPLPRPPQLDSQRHLCHIACRRQRDFYSMPQGLRSTNKSNLQMVSFIFKR